MKKYGNALKEQRKQKGYTLLEVEKATGINNGNISRWEQNKVIQSIYQCELLADFYDITIDELIGREKPYSETNTAKNFVNISHNSGTIGNILSNNNNKKSR